MKKEKMVRRISVGLTQQELDAYQDALRVVYSCGSETDELINQLSSRQRVELARNAIWAVCKAVVRAGCFPRALACDVRPETEEETAERLGEPLQQQLALADNIVPLFSADATAA